MKKILIAFLAPLLTACTLGALNAVSGSGNDHVVENVPYGPSQKQTLDVYVPNQTVTKAPVVVFFYGGRWRMGDKNDYRFAAHALTSQGFVVVIPNTRLYPQVRFPVFLQDGAQAVLWTKHHIAQYGGDPNALFTMGHSSGAYTALMLAMDKTYLTQAGGGLSDLRGAIGLAGPYDFLPFTDDDVKDIFSTANGHLQITQPITYATGKRPPALLLQGAGDQTVGVHNTRNLAAALRKHGSIAESKIYPEIGHIDILLSLSSAFRSKAPALRDSADFIRRYSGSRPAPTGIQ